MNEERVHLPRGRDSRSRRRAAAWMVAGAGLLLAGWLCARGLLPQWDPVRRAAACTPACTCGLDGCPGEDCEECSAECPCGGPDCAGVRRGKPLRRSAVLPVRRGQLLLFSDVRRDGPLRRGDQLPVRRPQLHVRRHDLLRPALRPDAPRRCLGKGTMPHA
ncbi:MAG: hypothetical protein NTW86_30215 [Candidatus Sumerlaeota bacterium]|nr:hypothetical protein [Candidatus Sumerlaeota bacterium]